MSFVNKTANSYGYKNKYWQILYGSYELYSLNDIVTEDLIIYKQLISINPNLISFISLDKNLSVLELNTNIQSDIYILLPLANINGFIKTIIFGESINTYKNNKNIIIYGKFYDTATNTIKCLSLKFNLSGQSLRIMSINDSTTTNNYWSILSGDYIVDTTNVDHLYNSYINKIGVNASIIFQEWTENDSIDISKSLYIIKLNSQLSEDIIFTLDNVNQTGLKKKFILSDSALNNLNNKNIIIRSKYYIKNQTNTFMLKIKLNNLNQYLELFSIDYSSSTYYQVLNDINSSFIDYDNTEQTLSLVSQPSINYEIITYDNSINNVLSSELDFSIIELNQMLTQNIYLYLPVASITNQVKNIIFGKSINQYINNKSIYLYTIIVDTSHNTLSYFSIEFKKSGQYIKLISINNDSNMYYQILTSDLTSITVLSTPSALITGLVNSITDTVDSENLIYTQSENNAIEILQYNKNQNNIVDLNKKFTLIELSENLTNDAYILIPNLKINGVEKNIIMGQSVSYFSNNYKVRSSFHYKYQSILQ